MSQYNKSSNLLSRNKNNLKADYKIDNKANSKSKLTAVEILEEETKVPIRARIIT